MRKTSKRKRKRFDELECAAPKTEATLLNLPGELVVAIVHEVGASSPLDATAFCSVNRQMRACSNEPLFEASALPPTVRRNIDTPVFDRHGVQRVSVAEAMGAVRRRDVMRRRVLYALYVLYAFTRRGDADTIRLVPFDVTEDDGAWASRLFRLMRNKRRKLCFGTVYIALPSLDVALDEQDKCINGRPLSGPCDSDYDAVNRVLTEALARVAPCAISGGGFSAPCVSVDICRAFMDGPDLPNGHYVRSNAWGIALNVYKMGHLWYPWTSGTETFESTVRGEPVHVYDNWFWRKSWRST